MHMLFGRFFISIFLLYSSALWAQDFGMADPSTGLWVDTSSPAIAAIPESSDMFLTPTPEAFVAPNAPDTFLAPSNATVPMEQTITPLPEQTIAPDHSDLLPSFHEQPMIPLGLWVPWALAGSLLILLIFFIMLYVRRQKFVAQAHDYLERSTIHLQEQKKYIAFLHTVADSMTDDILVLDKEGHYRFANKSALTHYQHTQEDVFGKTLYQVMGSYAAKPLLELNQAAAKQNKIIIAKHQIEENGITHVIRSTHVPMPNHEILITLHDLTDVVGMHEKNEHSLYQLMQTLVSLLACHDPYAAKHAQYTADVCEALIQEMGFDDAMRKTTVMAANLITIYNLLIPENILSKPSTLTKEEKDLITQSILQSNDILDHIDFGLPVIETLRQRLERWDGKGIPRHLTGARILMSSRILSVANAFVALVSPRVYREPKPFAEALNIILLGSERQYDPKVVAALMNYVNNRDGMTKWEHFSKKTIPLAATSIGQAQPNPLPVSKYHHLQYRTATRKKPTSLFQKQQPNA